LPFKCNLHRYILEMTTVGEVSVSLPEEDEEDAEEWETREGGAGDGASPASLRAMHMHGRPSQRSRSNKSSRAAVLPPPPSQPDDVVGLCTLNQVDP
jgi:hypothetical protein